jgi:Ca2+-dependent lipid-binding protein
MSSRTDDGLPPTPNLRLTIVAADGIIKRELFRLPDPFAVATVNGDQTQTTQAAKRSLNPYWNEQFDLYVSPSPAAFSALASYSLTITPMQPRQRGQHCGRAGV